MIAVLDDDEPVRRAVMRLLRAAGFSARVPLDFRAIHNVLKLTQHSFGASQQSGFRCGKRVSNEADRQGAALSELIILLATCALPLLWLFAVLMQARRTTARVRAGGAVGVVGGHCRLARLSRVNVLCEFSAAVDEINQPLTAILGNAEAALRLLKRDSTDLDFLREALDDIVASNRHALSVVQRLLALLRNEETQYLPFDLDQALRSALGLARSDLARRQVRVETRLDQRPHRVYGDRVQIAQVILNLITNACDAMADTPTEQRRLVLTTGDGSKPSEVELTVADQGVGIEPSQLEKIFQPFVTTKPDGLGLGLSICRSLIKAHGGRIWAEKVPCGAKFHIALPAQHCGEREELRSRRAP